MTPLQQAIKREFPDAGEDQVWLCSFIMNAVKAIERKEYVPGGDMKKLEREAYISSICGDISEGAERTGGMTIKSII